MGGRPRMPKECERRFWRLIGQGWSTERAAAEVGVSANTGERRFAQGGGMTPMTLAESRGRYLSLTEREHIDLRWEDGAGVRQIARELGRPASTVSRELRRNRLQAHRHRPPLPGGGRRRPGPVPGTQGPDRRPRLRDRAATAQGKGEGRGGRPKAAKPAQRAAPEAGQARRAAGPAGLGARGAGTAVEPRADRPPAAAGLPRR